jgi:ADP-ribose pyrophosphatase YjhB (NUDIX family)
MTNRDWLFQFEDCSCNFRTVGVLIQDGKILVQRDKDGTEYALPGGHVKIGESSEQSLIREYKEETGADISVDRLIWIEEHFWQWNNKPNHGIAFYYLISIIGDIDVPDNGEIVSQKDNCNVVLKWLPLEEVKKITIYPSFLPEKINSISNNIEYFKIEY